MKELNVTKNINIIESLKSGALFKIAELYEYQGTDGALTDKSDSISDLIILLYLLGDKMGYGYKEIDASIINRLKTGIKNDNTQWRDELKLLLRHFENMEQ